MKILLSHFTIVLLVLGACSAQAQTPSAAAPAAPAGVAGSVPADLTTAMQLPDGPDKKKAEFTAAQAWAKSDPKTFLDWVTAQDQATSAPLFSAMAAAGESADPKAAVELLVPHLTAPTMSTLHGFMLNWTKHDSAAAEAWSLQPSLPVDVRYLSIFTVADALCRKDPKSAVEWSGTITTLEDHLAAIDGTICIWIRGDPVAATAWIKTLNPTEMKRAALAGAASYGMAQKKLGTPLDAWVNDLTLSDADKQDVIKGPRIDDYHYTKWKEAAAAFSSAPAKS